MPKKKKLHLQQLIAKKQQLTQIAQGAVVSFEPAPTAVKLAEKVDRSVAVQPPATVHQAATAKAGRELKKTAVSIVLIAIILTAAVILDRRTPYFANFGDWLYRTLQLQG